MPHVIFPEFREEFKNTKYPFNDDATLTSIDRNLVIPQDIFVDANIYIPGAEPPAYISSINLKDSQGTITVTDITRQYSATGIIDYLADSVRLYENGVLAGILVTNKHSLSYFSNVPKAEYRFTDKATAFVPRCFTYISRLFGVTSIGIQDEDEVLRGDVWLCGKNGIIIRPKIGTNGSSIEFNVVGDPLAKQTLCSESGEYIKPNYVKSINGLTPDKYGDYKLAVKEHSDILRINNSPDGITLQLCTLPLPE